MVGASHGQDDAAYLERVLPRAVLALARRRARVRLPEILPATKPTSASDQSLYVWSWRFARTECGAYVPLGATIAVLKTTLGAEPRRG